MEETTTAADAGETPSNGSIPPALGTITPEEAARRRELAEKAARKYARWHPSVAPNRGGFSLDSLLTTFNPLVTLASIVLFIGLEGWLFGWPVAIGIAAVVFFHECGHAIAALIKGIPVTGLILIPFVGGVAIQERRGKSATEDAFIGIMGPIFGIVAGLACWGLYSITRQPFFLTLTNLALAMHFFNMLPISPLDGSRVLPLFQKQKREIHDPYYQRVTDAERQTYRAIYIAVALFCLVALILLHIFTDVP